jgi:TolB protein
MAKQPITPSAPEAAVNQNDQKAAPGITLFGELGGETAAPFVSQAARSLQQHTFTPEGRDFDPNVDRTGRLMVFASTRHAENPDIYIKSVSGSTVTQLTSEAASDLQPQFSPDAQKIAFASDRTGNWDIWVMNTNGGELTQITSSHAQEIHPSWSPDGTKLVYCALPQSGGEWELWTLSLPEPGTKKFIGYGLFPEWSPTEDRILFQRARQRGSRWFSVWTITMLNGEASRPTEVASSGDYALLSPSWSPDGTQIAFCALTPSAAGPGHSEPAGKSDLWIVDGDGRGRVCLTDGTAGDYSPTWSIDGRLYFTSNRAGRETVWSLLPIQNPLLTRGKGVLDGAQLGMR